MSAPIVARQRAHEAAAASPARGDGVADGHRHLLCHARRYVEYQRKQRMVLRYHKDALMAMAHFWKTLDSSNVSFMSLSKALAAIENSVTQACLWGRHTTGLSRSGVHSPDCCCPVCCCP
jgi:hypothetical protein